MHKKKSKKKKLGIGTGHILQRCIQDYEKKNTCISLNTYYIYNMCKQKKSKQKWSFFLPFLHPYCCTYLFQPLFFFFFFPLGLRAVFKDPFHLIFLAFNQLPFYLKGQRVYRLYVKSLLRVVCFLNISVFRTVIAQS